MNCERIETLDTLYAFDTSAGDSLWNLAALWWAGTGTAPDAATLGNYLPQADASASINELSHTMLDLVGASSVPAADFVTYLYKTILNVNPTPEQVASVTALMGHDHVFETNADLLAYVAVQTYNTDKMVAFTGTVQQIPVADL